MLSGQEEPMAESPTYEARTRLLRMVEEIKTKSLEYNSITSLNPLYLEAYNDGVNTSITMCMKNLAELDKLLSEFTVQPDDYVDALNSMVSALSMIYDMLQLAITIHKQKKVGDKILDAVQEIEALKEATFNGFNHPPNVYKN
jgi:hypothetical protein